MNHDRTENSCTVSNNFDKGHPSPVHDPFGAVRRYKGHVVCQVHACPGPLKVSTSFPGPFPWPQSQGKDPGNEVVKVCFIFSITNNHERSHMIGWTLYTLLGWVLSVNKLIQKKTYYFALWHQKVAGKNQVICEATLARNNFKDLIWQRANSSFNKILVLPSLIYNTVSAETDHSRNDQQPLSQSG